jgi:hypothetical protein
VVDLEQMSYNGKDFPRSCCHFIGVASSCVILKACTEYGSTDHLLDRSAVVHRVLKKRRVGVAMERAYTLSDVEEAVCRMTRIDREELRRTQRKPALKRARELFMYLGAVIRGRVCVK